MSVLKHYSKLNVYQAAKQRIAYVFDHFERPYVSFSGGKDSTVMLHMVAREARRRERTFGILVIDLEAQYTVTMEHVAALLDRYADCSEQYWVCLPLLLRNAVSQFQPRWCCWEPEAREGWVREFPNHASVISDIAFFPFFVPKMEFEEFMVLFGIWYGGDKLTAAFVGIRCDESLNRFRTIATSDKIMHGGNRFTTLVAENLFNVYPIYDWKTEDIWIYHAKFRKRQWNRLYDLMHLAGLTIHQMRICQPYGDDQRRGLWLYHLIEPESWFRVVARVNGANSGALYINETGNINGYVRIAKPPGHTWKTFCNLLLESLPRSTRAHYIEKFKKFLHWWRLRGYIEGTPDEAPRLLEVKALAPSWRRLCRVLLRNDWWCKSLHFSQPKSKAYERYLQLVRERKTAMKIVQTSVPLASPVRLPDVMEFLARRDPVLYARVKRRLER